MAGDKFKKFKSSLNRGVTTIGVKSYSILEKSKINGQIESLEKEIKKLFASIGESAYAAWNSGNNDYQSIFELCEVVKQKKLEIVQLNEQYSSIDERDAQILNKEDQGAQIEISDESQGKNIIVCPKCGSQFNNQAKFCRNCGNKLQED